MFMKKTILVITCDKDAALYHAKLLQSLFGEKTTVLSASVSQVQQEGLMPADLYCATTDAVEHLPNLQEQIRGGSDIVLFFVTFSQEMLEKLNAVPPGTKALFVNFSEKMAQECITSLNQLGINHIHFRPWYPGADKSLAEGIRLAVTPDEERYVPEGIRTVINLGQRQIDCNTVMEVLLKLKFYDMMEDPHIRAYLSSIASNSYSFDELMGRSFRMESSFQNVIDVLDIGIIGANENNDIFVYNKKAEQIIGSSLNDAIGRKAEAVVPFLPFAECRQTLRTISSRLIRFHGMPLNTSIVPIVRRRNHVGTIAMFQHFGEEEARQHKLRVQLLDKGHKAKYTFDDIVGESPAILKIKDIARKMARTKSSILITGESGTGKELFAHAIHNASNRKDFPFIAINCAALPENLLESELFGYVDGAFTGAKKGGKMGLFEFAHTGTLFLDEVEGMSPLLQIKLLRVIQEHEVMRVGDSRLITVDVRIIAATNEKLEKRLEEGNFRQDLYYRLNTLPIDLPPLRERKTDIMPLLETFKKELGSSFSVSPQVRQRLVNHEWSGNIRELHNYAEYFTYLNKEVIEEADLPPGFYHQPLAEKSRAGEAGPKETAHSAFRGELSGRGQGKSRLILTMLADGLEEGRKMGRKYLVQEAKKTGVSLSEYETRGILEAMEREGYVKRSKGRGGTQITEKGYQLVEKWKKNG